MNKSKLKLNIVYIIIIACTVIAIAFLIIKNNQNASYTNSTFAMNTFVSQTVYGQNGEEIGTKVFEELYEFEQLISLYVHDSDIDKINTNAGIAEVNVSETTINLLQQAVNFSTQSNGAFAVTLAPLTTLWAVTSSTPTVPTQAQIDELLPLINDNDIIIDMKNNTVMLKNEGQGIDLGGIAKGYACNVVQKIYEDSKISGALLSIGGNVYAWGTKPDNSLFRIGFKNPNGVSENSAIASVTMKDMVFSVSGGYERYFEQDGEVYHHILDPTTGKSAQTDILSVGVMHSDGASADFYSTSLFVSGLESALNYIESGGIAMVLDKNNNLYVSQSLKNDFELVDNSFNVIFVSNVS